MSTNYNCDLELFPLNGVKSASQTKFAKIMIAIICLRSFAVENHHVFLFND